MIGRSDKGKGKAKKSSGGKRSREPYVWIAWVNRKNRSRGGFLRGEWSPDAAEQLCRLRNAVYDEDFHWPVPMPDFHQVPNEEYMPSAPCSVLRGEA